MKALQAACLVGAITFTGMIHQVGGSTPDATVPEAAASTRTPGSAALSAAVAETSGGPGTAPGAVPGAVSGPPFVAQAEIGDDSFEAKWMALGRHDAGQPVPTTRDAPGDVPKP